MLCTHLNQFLACSCYESRAYHAALKYMWESYMMRVFKDLFYMYGEFDINLFSVKDLLNPPETNKCDPKCIQEKTRHAKFAKKIFDLICDLVFITTETTQIMEYRKNESLHSSDPRCNQSIELKKVMDKVKPLMCVMFEKETKNMHINQTPLVSAYIISGICGIHPMIDD